MVSEEEDGSREVLRIDAACAYACAPTHSP